MALSPELIRQAKDQMARQQMNRQAALDIAVAGERHKNMLLEQERFKEQQKQFNEQFKQSQEQFKWEKEKYLQHQLPLMQKEAAARAQAQQRSGAMFDASMAQKVKGASAEARLAVRQELPIPRNAFGTITDDPVALGNWKKQYAELYAKKYREALVDMGLSDYVDQNRINAEAQGDAEHVEKSVRAAPATQATAQTSAQVAAPKIEGANASKAMEAQRVKLDAENKAKAAKEAVDRELSSYMAGQVQLFTNTDAVSAMNEGRNVEDIAEERNIAVDAVLKDIESNEFDNRIIKAMKAQGLEISVDEIGRIKGVFKAAIEGLRATKRSNPRGGVPWIIPDYSRSGLPRLIERYFGKQQPSATPSQGQTAPSTGYDPVAEAQRGAEASRGEAAQTTENTDGTETTQEYNSLLTEQ